MRACILVKHVHNFHFWLPQKVNLQCKSCKFGSFIKYNAFLGEPITWNQNWNLGTVGTVLPGTESRTRAVGTVFRNWSPNWNCAHLSKQVRPWASPPGQWTRGPEPLEPHHARTVSSVTKPNRGHPENRGLEDSPATLQGPLALKSSWRPPSLRNWGCARFTPQFGGLNLHPAACLKIWRPKPGKFGCWNRHAHKFGAVDLRDGNSTYIFQHKFLAPTSQKPAFWTSRKNMLPGKECKRMTHINFYGEFWVKEGVPNGRFWATKSFERGPCLQILVVKTWNCVWNCVWIAGAKPVKKCRWKKFRQLSRVKNLLGTFRSFLDTGLQVFSGNEGQDCSTVDTNGGSERTNNNNAAIEPHWAEGPNGTRGCHWTHARQNEWAIWIWEFLVTLCNWVRGFPDIPLSAAFAGWVSRPSRTKRQFCPPFKRAPTGSMTCAKTTWAHPHFWVLRTKFQNSQQGSREVILKHFGYQWHAVINQTKNNKKI